MEADFKDDDAVKDQVAALMTSLDELSRINADLEGKCAGLSARVIELEAPSLKYETCIQVGTLDSLKKNPDGTYLSIFTSLDANPKSYSFNASAGEAVRIAPLLGKTFVLTIREK